jgi:hypothetical protein
MAATLAARRPRAAAGPARRVVLTFVSRRDGAQRLSLAFGLLARAAPAGPAECSAAPGRPQPPPRWLSEVEP